MHSKSSARTLYCRKKIGWQKIVNDECVSMCRGYTNATIYSDPSLTAHFQETWEVK